MGTGSIGVHDRGRCQNTQNSHIMYWSMYGWDGMGDGMNGGVAGIELGVFVGTMWLLLCLSVSSIIIDRGLLVSGGVLFCTVRMACC